MSGLTNDQVNSVRKLADQYGLSQAFILGVVEKESAGRVFWTVGGKNVPAIRPEGHYFYKYLSGAKRTLAVKQGLAAKKAGVVRVPGKYEAVYQMFNRMVAIDKDAACKSISMGLGQVMGAHATKIGFKSATEMFVRCSQGLTGQVEVMLRFITADPALVKAVNAHDFTAFARRYNGPGYRKNRYDVLLKQHTEKWEGLTGATRRIAVTQESRVVALGFGSVEEFQEHHGLEPDGDIGFLTGAKLDEVEKAGKKAAAAPARNGGILAGVGAVSAGGIGGVEQVSGWIEQAQDHAAQAHEAFDRFAPMLATVRTVMKVLPTVAVALGASVAVGAAVYVAWHYWKAKQA